MTPRERWNAAVDLQHAALAELSQMPLVMSEEQEDRYCAVLNHASYELRNSWDAWAGYSNTQIPVKDLPADQEWYSAYGILRNFQLKTSGPRRMAYAARDAGLVACDAAALWPRVAAMFERTAA